MRITYITLSLLHLSFLHSFAASQQTPPPPRAVKTITNSAERDITVFFDPQFLFDSEDINEILQSKQFAAAAIEELTGRRAQLFQKNREGYGNIPGWGAVPGAEFYAQVWGRRDLIAGSSQGSLPLRLHVVVFQPEGEGKADAEKYAELIIKHLDKVLGDLSRRSLEQGLTQLKVTADEARRAADSATQKVEELSARLRKSASALSESALQELIGDLMQQRQSLEVDLAGMEGRAEALKREIAKSSERLKKSSAEDEVLRNLQQVLELRTAAFQLAKQASNVGARGIGPIEVTKAEEQVALAKVELAQARQAAARPSDDR